MGLDLDEIIARTRDQSKDLSPPGHDDSSDDDNGPGPTPSRQINKTHSQDAVEGLSRYLGDMGVAGANQMLDTYYNKKKADKLCLSDIDRKSRDDKLSNEAEEIQIVRSKVNRHSTPIANSGSSKIRSSRDNSDDLNSSCPSRLDHKPKKSKKKRTKDRLTTASGSEDTLMNSSNASLNSSFIGSSKSSKKVNSGQKMKDTWK